MRKPAQNSRSSLNWSDSTPKSTYLDAQSLYIVQAVNESLYISAMAKLVCHVIHFELGAIGIVVAGVTVDIPIEEDCVEGKSPVRRRGMVGVIRPASPVVERRNSRGVFIQVEANLGWVISESLT